MRRILLVTVAATCLMCNKVETVSENEAIFEQSDVFVGGQDGIFEYRIPVLVTSNEGTLLAFCDARVEKEGDPPNNIDLALKRSFDGGKTWGPLQLLVDAGEGAVADSCGLVDRRTGTIWVFSVYCPTGIGSATAKPGLTGDTFMYWAVKSDDDGETWSEPIDITAMVKKPEWRAGSPGPGTGIQTRSGRLIIPRYYAAGDGRSVVFLSYSDDHGKTWRMGGEAKGPWNTNETQVVELDDGSLLLNMRGVTGNQRKIARSSDGGMTWSEMTEDPALIEPRCQGSLIVHTDGLHYPKSRLVFLNPASLERNNMTARLSYDEGKTWPISKQLYAGPSAYSSLTVLQDLTIGCLYERGGQGPYEKITFARFNLEWLTDGKDKLAAMSGSR